MAKKKVIILISVVISIIAVIAIFFVLKFNNKKEALIIPLNVTKQTEFIFYANEPNMLYAGKEKTIFHLNGNVYTYSFKDLKVVDAYSIVLEPNGIFNGTYKTSFADKYGKNIYTKFDTLDDLKCIGAIVYHTETKRVKRITEEKIKLSFSDRFPISYDDPAIKEIALVSNIARINKKEYVYVCCELGDISGTITYVNGDNKTTYNIFENN